MKLGLLGKVVIMHLSLPQQGVAGGNHVPNYGNLRIAPAIIVNDPEPENENPHPVNLKVFCDSRDELWVTGAMPGSEPGQWETKEAFDARKEETPPEVEVKKEEAEFITPVK